jgi:hypothetical protein
MFKLIYWTVRTHGPDLVIAYGGTLTRPKSLRRAIHRTVWVFFISGKYDGSDHVHLMQRSSSSDDAGTLYPSVARSGVHAKTSTRSTAIVVRPQENVDRREQTSDSVRETG